MQEILKPFKVATKRCLPMPTQQRRRSCQSFMFCWHSSSEQVKENRQRCWNEGKNCEDLGK
ncbi:Hypothetical protein FKW44_008513 [Caligus rogercresseyi]|uniref:Uncharacterized protein n=1 Tax=Caligus rogercresseyi TaxID=217165 RepID=A0A7T8KG84_CALRO|nr:Hypothetical protein FKW44_008513 [Caligus rogercresseyi]